MYCNIILHAVCPSGYTQAPFNNKCYMLSSSKESYADAITQCQMDGAVLAEPTSDEENTYIIELDNSNEVWIGVSDGIGIDPDDLT